MSNVESAPVVPQRYNITFKSPTSQWLEGRELEDDIALFRKYEPVHICYSLACSS